CKEDFLISICTDFFKKTVPLIRHSPRRMEHTPWARPINYGRRRYKRNCRPSTSRCWPGGKLMAARKGSKTKKPPRISQGLFKRDWNLMLSSEHEYESRFFWIFGHR